MKRPTAYRLRSFQGVMILFVVDEDQHTVVTLSNHVSYIHAKVMARDTFERDFTSVRLTEEAHEQSFVRFKNYAISTGLTPEGAVYLTKFIPMSPAELRTALTKGLETRARIKKEAEAMAKADKNPGAPRKLAGAAAAAVKRKEERLAAEAKALAGQVSNDMEQVEDQVVDATLGQTPKKATEGSKPSADVKKGQTPKTKKQAKEILTGKSQQAKFDVEKLKVDGKWKSASAMFKGLIYEGKLSDDKIAAAVDKQFDLGAEKAVAYVKWNRGWFKREGIALPNAK